MKILLSSPARPGERVEVIGEGVTGPVLWRGAPTERLVPVDVEFTIDEDLKWKHVHRGQARPDADRVRIAGVVQSIDDRGVVTLAVQGGGLLLFGTTGRKPWRSMLGETVTVYARSVTAFPTGAEITRVIWRG